MKAAAALTLHRCLLRGEKCLKLFCFLTTHASNPLPHVTAHRGHVPTFLPPNCESWRRSEAEISQQPKPTFLTAGSSAKRQICGRFHPKVFLGLEHISSEFGFVISSFNLEMSKVLKNDVFISYYSVKNRYKEFNFSSNHLLVFKHYRGPSTSVE